MKKLYIDLVVAESFHGSASMRGHFEKNISRVVKLENGYLVAISKPRIEKNFCFGYSDSRYDTEDYDRANAMANHARTNTDYFIEQNMRQIESQINAFDKWHPVIRTAYCNAPEDTIIKTIDFMDDYHFYTMSDVDKAKVTSLSPADKTLILEAYKEEKKAFEKTLCGTTLGCRPLTGTTALRLHNRLTG